MNKQQKELTVKDLQHMYSANQALFVVQYGGLNVQELFLLRKVLRENGGILKVTKARLMKKAAHGVDGISALNDDFKGQIGLVFASKEVAPIAKHLFEFAKEHESLKVLAGFYESQVLSAADAKFVASLPSREVIVAQVAAMLLAPMASLVSLLNAPMQQLVYVLNQVASKEA
jgi:Ribosomal protein L10